MDLSKRGLRVGAVGNFKTSFFMYWRSRKSFVSRERLWKGIERHLENMLRQDLGGYFYLCRVSLGQVLSSRKRGRVHSQWTVPNLGLIKLARKACVMNSPLKFNYGSVRTYGSLWKHLSYPSVDPWLVCCRNIIQYLADQAVSVFQSVLKLWILHVLPWLLYGCRTDEAQGTQGQRESWKMQEG